MISTRTCARLTVGLLTLASAGCGFFFGGSKTTLPSLGVLKAETLCSDVKRCDVRGDSAVSTLTGRHAIPIHLAAGQGPESYLGKVAPKRVANSVLKTCGGDVTRDDWLASGPAARTLELTDDGRAKLRGSLKAHLAESLLAHPEVMVGQTASMDSTIEAASSGLGLPRIGLLSQTFWLKDSAFERRVGQCGEENYTDIIYSLTLLRLSDLTQKDLETKLVRALEAKLPLASIGEADEGASAEPLDPMELLAKSEKPAASAEPTAKVDPIAAHHELIRELAYSTVQAFAAELRTIAALGFDEP
ncbi:MAG: hypothetical protein JWN48_5009 [Myxococcaceae bacterium]|nr:hypothetical protein [Myxococcaceae bacterium]